jgi:hypothetical protein
MKSGHLLAEVEVGGPVRKNHGKPLWVRETADEAPFTYGKATLHLSAVTYGGYTNPPVGHFSYGSYCSTKEQEVNQGATGQPENALRRRQAW